ncbi:hypothetical protein BGX31_001512 [Mortierella sp. GBA43]|nr:hypothetical protein BGX31_001512 [Mortierella sp. GBA43]
MQFDYVLLAVLILIPLGLFRIFRSDPLPGLGSTPGKASLPGAFGDSTKAKKKRAKKKGGANKSGHSTTEPAEPEQESQDESESEPVATIQSQSSESRDVTMATDSKKAGKKKVSPSSVSVKSNDTNSEKGSTTTSLAVSASSASEVNHSNNNNIINVNSNNNSNNNSKTAKPTSVENWKRTHQGQQKEQLAKQQELLQFAAAASKNVTPSSVDPSLHIASIPGPGATGSDNKKKRNNAGSGLSHTDFPILARPQPTSSAAPRQPKPLKQKKEVSKNRGIEPVDEPKRSLVQPGVGGDDEMDEDDEEYEDEEEQRDKDGDKEYDETRTNSAESRSGGIDFDKPMDPWVAQKQREMLERVSDADPHGERTEKYARVLSIKPAAKDERISEPIPDGFEVQRSRVGGGSSGYSSQPPAELTKKQRENLARTAKKKEEKAAADALQEQRRRDHMKQLKGEKMREFYHAQRKQAPESRWKAPNTAAASSGLIWD